MKTTSLLHLPLSRVSVLILAFALALATAFTTGCGSGGSGGSIAFNPPASSSVTVLLSSTVNDQLTKVFISFSSITMTSQSGKTVDLYNAIPTNGVYSGGYEFIHLNGIVEPLVTVSVPQGVYTSATATIAPGSYMSCVAFDAVPSPGALAVYSNTPLSQAEVTVNLPTPITVTGTAMGISLAMLLPSSALSACTNYAGAPSLTPTFNLTPVAISSQPTNGENGAESNLDGQISSVKTADSSFTLVLADGQTLSVNPNTSTVYQGINGFSALTAGTFVDMDAAIQSDGSQLATRIAVEDTDTTNLSVAIGPVLAVLAANPVVDDFGRQEQGYLTTFGQAALLMHYDYGNAAFQVSGQFTSLQDLPFPARFDAGSIFGAQNVYITTHALTIGAGPTYIPATTITLMPQTINGTVVGVSTSGIFQIYNVALASYDLPPILASQPGLSYILNNPSTVEVYVDSNTQLLNQQPLAPGSIFRFNGLLFNDGGTIRMDCGQVNDGVTE